MNDATKQLAAALDRLSAIVADDTTTGYLADKHWTTVAELAAQNLADVLDTINKCAAGTLDRAHLPNPQTYTKEHSPKSALDTTYTSP